jgi:hypothetical protein
MEQTMSQFDASPRGLELLDRRAVCAVFGNIHAAMLYRGIRQGRYPKPIKVGSLS